MDSLPVILGTLAIPVAIGIIIDMGVAFLVYKDAKTNNLHDPGGWGWLTVLSPILFGLLYLLWGKNHTPSYRYPNCQCAECGRAK